MPSVDLRDAVAQPRTQDDLRSEWQALTSAAGVIRGSDFGILRVDGGDHVSWLDNLVTASVESMGEGTALYALLLEAKGHVVADFVVLKQSDMFLLYTSRAAYDNLLFNLRRSIFREKVTLTDATDQFNILSLQGPTAREILRNTSGGNLSLSESLTLSTNFFVSTFQFNKFDIIVVLNPCGAKDSFDLLVPPAIVHTFTEVLVANGAYIVGLDALNITRVEAGIPSYGVDFDETTLAPEALLDAFIADNKGCYPGQEVIARIRNLGHVNRLLVQLQVDGSVVPSPGETVFVGDKEAGVITSAVWSYANNAPLALGYLRRESASDGIRVEIAHEGSRLSAKIKTLTH